MPADAGTGKIFIDQNLRKIRGSNSGDSGCAGTYWLKFSRQVGSVAQDAPSQRVAKPEMHHPAFCGHAMQFEFMKWQSLNRGQQFALFLKREEVLVEYQSVRNHRGSK